MKTAKGPVVVIRRVHENDDLMLITSNGMIVRIAADTVRQTGRNTQGVRVVNLVSGDQLVGVARIAENDDPPDGDPGAPTTE